MRRVFRYTVRRFQRGVAILGSRDDRNASIERGKFERVGKQHPGGIKDHRRPLTIRKSADRIGERRGGGIDGMVGTILQRGSEIGLTANGGNNRSTTAFSNLDRSRTNPASSPKDKGRFSSGKCGSRNQRRPSRNKRNTRTRGTIHGESRRFYEHSTAARGSTKKLRMRPVPSKPNITPRAKHFSLEKVRRPPHHHARKITPRNPRQRRPMHTARNVLHIARIDGRSMNRNQHILRSGHRCRNLFNPKLRRFTELANDDSLHGSPFSSSAGDILQERAGREKLFLIDRVRHPRIPPQIDSGSHARKHIRRLLNPRIGNMRIRIAGGEQHRSGGEGARVIAGRPLRPNKPASKSNERSIGTWMPPPANSEVRQACP